jgi:hypothetical protein
LRKEPLALSYDAQAGREVDLRPPHVQLAAAEQQYADLLAAGNVADAVRVLVSRRALVRLIFGDPSLKLAQASVTLAKAYLDLQGQGQHALRHAEAAQQQYQALQGGAAPIPANELQLLAAQLFCVLGRASLAMGEATKADRFLLRAEAAVAALADLGGAHATAELDFFIARGLGEAARLQEKHALAHGFFNRARDIARAEAQKPSAGKAEPIDTRPVPWLQCVALVLCDLGTR